MGLVSSENVHDVISWGAVDQTRLVNSHKRITNAEWNLILHPLFTLSALGVTLPHLGAGRRTISRDLNNMELYTILAGLHILLNE